MFVANGTEMNRRRILACVLVHKRIPFLDAVDRGCASKAPIGVLLAHLFDPKLFQFSAGLDVGKGPALCFFSFAIPIQLSDAVIAACFRLVHAAEDRGILLSAIRGFLVRFLVHTKIPFLSCGQWVCRSGPVGKMPLDFLAHDIVGECLP